MVKRSFQNLRKKDACGENENTHQSNIVWPNRSTIHPYSTNWRCWCLNLFKTQQNFMWWEIQTCVYIILVWKSWWMVKNSFCWHKMSLVFFVWCFREKWLWYEFYGRDGCWGVWNSLQKSGVVCLLHGWSDWIRNMLFSLYLMHEMHASSVLFNYLNFDYYL